jgi:hypothetical protein
MEGGTERIKSRTQTIRNSRSLRNACSLLCIVLILLCFSKEKSELHAFGFQKLLLCIRQSQTQLFRPFGHSSVVSRYVPAIVCPSQYVLASMSLPQSQTQHRSASASIWFPASGGENVQGTTPNYKCGILRRFVNEHY